MTDAKPLLLGLEVVEQHRALLALLTPVAEHNARAVDDLARVTLAVQHACSPTVSIKQTTIKGG